MQLQLITNQLFTKMTTDYNDLKRTIALATEGRFIPYIGELYDAGVGPSYTKNNPRILIIGPRHYCDASYSSRNLLAYMSDEMREELSNNPDARFPHNLKVGCTETSAKECLKLKHNKCPVYLAEHNKHCPLSIHCKIRCYAMKEDGFPCNSVRNLRCETLYAVYEYLNKPSIESARLGITYFDSITKFITEEFHYVLSSKKDAAKEIWRKVSFTNLIQRYIPLKDTNFDSNTIQRYITPEDISFCKESIIDNLNPDYIVMTMPCIEYALRTILGNKYELHKAYKNSGWYVYKAKKSTSMSIKSKWELICEEFFRSYEFPSTSIAFGEEIYNLVEVLNNDSLTSGESNRSRTKNIRTKILETIWRKLKKSPTPPTYINSVKCLNYNLELTKGESIMRKWISNAHNGIINQPKRIHSIRWSIEKITNWLNANR